MDQISISYVDMNKKNLQMSVASKIVDAQGGCTDLDICLFCPFVDECLGKVLSHAQFLDKETRLQKAEEFLFTDVLEGELE